MTTCCFCHQAFDDNDLIQLAGNWVCANCKPRCVQMMREGVDHLTGEVGRYNKIVVGAIGADLPDRCIHCNQPGAHRSTWCLHYYQRWLLLFLWNWLIMLILALLVRKEVRVAFSFCEVHYRRRRIHKALSLAFGLVGLGLAVAGFGLTISELAVLGILLAVLAAGYGYFTLKTLAPVKVSKTTYHLRGAGQSFLQSLPVHPEWRSR